MNGSDQPNLCASATSTPAETAPLPFRVRSRVVAAIVVGCIATSLTGCSLFVMGGKLLFGDPKTPSQFRAQTGINLQKDEGSVLVVCSVPESARSEQPSLDLDLSDGILRRMRRQGIQVVNPDEVASWLDDHGGRWNDISELAEAFDAKYLARVELEQYSCHMDHSPSMYRGTAVGQIDVFQVEKKDGIQNVIQVYSGEFRTEYPPLYPVSSEEISLNVFQQRFLEHVCTRLARVFHDYHARDDI